MEITGIKRFIPSTIISGKKKSEYVLEIEERQDHYYVYYRTILHNAKGPVGKRTYDTTLPKQLTLDEESYEVIGLLQGEMSKTYREMLTFANSEPSIIKKVIQWFSKQNLVQHSEWNWYIRFNIPEPKQREAAEIEKSIVPFWTEVCGLSMDRKYDKTCTWTPHSKNPILTNKGTLLIEKGNRIFVQVMQNIVARITASMPDRNLDVIIPFMRGIIAAESCINYNLVTGHRRVFITATKEDERKIFRKCLHKLGIQTQDCKPIKDIVISRKENIMRMHELNLMTGHPEKLRKFNKMISNYTDWWHEKRKKATGQILTAAEEQV